MKLTQEENMTLDMMIDSLNDRLNEELGNEGIDGVAGLLRQQYSLLRKLRTIAQAYNQGTSLLRPVQARPTVCYCPPDQCQAPNIHGQQVACLRGERK